MAHVPVIGDSAVQALIGLIYDAALEPSGWKAFLESYAATVKATSGVLLYHDVRDHRGAVSTDASLDPNALRGYNERFATIDPWVNATEAMGLMKTGTIVIGEEVVSRSSLLRTEYYNDFAKGYGITRTLSGVIRRDGHVISAVSTLRPDSQAPFSPRERAVLRALLPHLYRAMQLRHRLASLECENAALLDAVDRLPMGLVICHRDATVARANRAANEILGQRDGLTIDCNELRTARPGETRMLRMLVGNAASTAGGTGTGCGGALSVSRPSAKPPLSVLVTPLRAHVLPSFGAHGMAALFINDPERAVEADAETIRHLWGLTESESAIAVKLAAGQDIEEIAAKQSVSEGTVRWHVKHVLAKTNTRRQADLVRLLTTGPSIVRGGRY